MDIPPFPSQDLAKLVLGYLAEEELMTAYDEFLQVSPYLDAYKNEYDRILMMSLRSILADYRAVKIYVESCKPYPLRKKLLQCYNLLEMVKYLITIVDIKKLPIQENLDRNSITNNNVSPRMPCDVCLIMNLKRCVCKNNSITSESQHSTVEQEIPTLPKSLEATPLANLPVTGNALLSNKESGREIKNNSLEQAQLFNLMSNNKINESHVTSDTNVCVQLNTNHRNQTQTVLDSRQKIEEFNTILDLVCNKSVTNEKLCDNLVSNSVSSVQYPVSTFQDFTSSVQGTNHDRITRVPELIPADTVLKAKLPYPKAATVTALMKPTAKSDVSEKKCDKIIKNKVNILSDIRFQKDVSHKKPPSILKSTVASPPCMKKIMINGIPGYSVKNDINARPYSKEEIIDMPTLIILPTSGANDQKVNTCNSTTSSTLYKCEPLFVDVNSSNINPSLAVTDTNQDADSKTTKEFGLIKIVGDYPTHTSLANNSTISNNKSTTQTIPLLNNSTSTPRRSSHIRILDFNTPRRILDEEAKIEKKSDDSVEIINSPVEMTHVSASVKDLNTNVKASKPKNKKEWDDDIRAVSRKDPVILQSLRTVRIKKKIKQNIPMDQDKCDKSMKTKSRTRKHTKDIEETQSISSKKPIKATIRIVSAEDVSHSEIKNNHCINKHNDEVFDTPENERLSLQNEIEGKLNLSDLLETPYKQAIYDLQMETPRFLGVDFPGDPLSDIKITNIPTPRFFDSPKPPQATPSSYSSRPTDYSSGGSYYKPDDQEYIDLSETKRAFSKKEELIPIDSTKAIDESTSSKSKRPTRTCAKNVSYVNHQVVRWPSFSNDVSFQQTETIKSRTSDTKMSVAKKSSKSKNKKSVKHKSPTKRKVTKNFMKIKPRRVTPLKDTKKRKTLPDFTLGTKKNLLVPLLEAESIKSRRKSSTPRKLHRGKLANLSSSNNISPDSPHATPNKGSDLGLTQNNYLSKKPFRFNDTSAMYKNRENSDKHAKEDEDSITEIKKLIKSMNDKKLTNSDEYTINKIIQKDKSKRSLDVETAKIIERVLLDTPPLQDGAVQSTSNDVAEEHTTQKVANDCLKSDFNANKQSTHNSHEIAEEIEDIEFSVQESNKDASNYFTCSFDESTFTPKNAIPLKDKFCMEVCIDDGVILRLKTTDFNELFNEAPAPHYDDKELTAAVSSISNILCTPIKDQRARYYEVFDSTLTSIDTPLKENSPQQGEHDTSVTEITEDVENAPTKKRKHLHSGEEESSSTKKSKSDPPYLLNHTTIQNIDIESVLSKLHGP